MQLSGVEVETTTDIDYKLSLLKNSSVMHSNALQVNLTALVTRSRVADSRYLLF